MVKRGVWAGLGVAGLLSLAALALPLQASPAVEYGVSLSAAELEQYVGGSGCANTRCKALTCQTTGCAANYQTNVCTLRGTAPGQYCAAGDPGGSSQCEPPGTTTGWNCSTTYPRNCVELRSGAPVSGACPPYACAALGSYCGTQYGICTATACPNP